MSESFYIPKPGTRCRHSNYGRGAVLVADEEYTTINFIVGLKKFITSLMVLEWNPEVLMETPPAKREPKPRVKREPRLRAIRPPKVNRDGDSVRGPSTEKRCRQVLSRHSTSGFKGVSWDKTHGYWVANICFRGRTRWLGSFDTAEAAAKAYEAAALERAAELAAK
jgi:hypothetical protein